VATIPDLVKRTKGCKEHFSEPSGMTNWSSSLRARNAAVVPRAWQRCWLLRAFSWTLRQWSPVWGSPPWSNAGLRLWRSVMAAWSWCGAHSQSISLHRPAPRTMHRDKSAKFAGRLLDLWACYQGVELHCLRAGKLIDVALIEPFIRRLRGECLNSYCFGSLEENQNRAPATGL